MENLKLVASNKGFSVYFNADLQEYFVFKDDLLLIRGKHKFSEVKCYLD